MKCLTILRVRLWKYKSYSLSLVFVLSLGILVFSTFAAIRDEIVSRPLPLYDPERLVQVKLLSFTNGQELELDHFTYAEFRQWRDNSSNFECLVALQDGEKDNSVDLQGLGEPERLNAIRITNDFFRCMGLAPSLGSGFAFRGASGVEEAILSAGLWARKLGATRDVLGKKIILDKNPYQVVGVLPGSFNEETAQPLLQKNIDVWLPLREAKVRIDSRSVRIFGRLKKGRTLAMARQELSALSGMQSNDQGNDKDRISVSVTLLQDEVSRKARPTLFILMAAGVLIAALTCSSGISLLLARNMARSREIAILSALGAGPLRLVMNSLIEGIALSGAAGLLSALSLDWSVWLCIHLFPKAIMRQADAWITERYFGVIAVISVVTGLILGASSVIRGASEDLYENIKDGGGSSVAPRRIRRLRRVANAQIAIALALLVGAGLVLRSYVVVARMTPGMKLEDVLVFDMYLPPYKGSSVADRRVASFFREIKEQIAELPQVETVALTSSVPLRNRDYFYNQWRLRKVDEDYFSLLDIPILQGHGFDESGADPNEVVINRSLARKIFPQGVRIGSLLGGKYRVIGVVQDNMHEEVGAPPQPAVYLCSMRKPDNRMSILIRTSGAPRQLVPAIKKLVWSIDPDLPISNLSTLEEVAAGSEAQVRRRSLIYVLGALSVVSLMLAAIGVYGVLDLLGLQRRKEYAIRMALGAGFSQLFVLELRRTYELVRSGVGFGLILALIGSLYISDIILDLSVLDIQAFIGAIVVIGVVILSASVVNLRKNCAKAFGQVLAE